MQKGQTSKKVSSLVLGSSMFLMSLLPAASAFAATAPTLSMTGPSNISVSPGGSATFTVSGSGLASNEEYQFWVETPSGKWQVAQNYSSNNSFTINNAQTGNYLVEAYAMTPAQIKAGDWSAAVASNHGESDGIFVGSTVTTKTVVAGTSTPATDVAPGTQITAMASSTGVYNPQYQFWVQAPSGHTWGNGSAWKQLGGYTTSSSATFTAPWAGDYKVVAYAKSPLGLNNPAAALMSNEATPAAYGTAAAVELSPASSSLVADGQATDTITATVVDSNGNVVKNYNGSVVVNDSTNKIVQTGPNGSTTTVGQASVTVKDGVGSFKVQAGTTVGTVQDLTTSNLQNPPSNTNITYNSAEVTQTQPSVTQFGLTASPASMTVNTSKEATTPTSVTITEEDAAGNPYTASLYATVTLSGPGSFSSTSSVKTEKVYLGSGSGSVNVYGIKGTPGTVTVSATASSGQTGSVQIPSYVNSAPGSLAITSKQGTITSGPNQGTSYTVYTVQMLDTNGNPISQGAGSMDGIKISDNASSSAPLKYYSYSNGTVGGTSSSSPIVTTLTNGSYQFAVENTTTASTPATITVNDTSSPDTSLSASATYNYSVGTPSFVSSSYPYTQGYLKGGSTYTYSVQLKDQYGNKLMQSGVPVSFNFAGGPNGNSANATLPNNTTGGGPGSGYIAWTNSQGVASVTVTVPSGQTAGSFQLQGQLENGGSAPAPGVTAPGSSMSPTETVEPASNFATSMQFTGTSSSSTVTAGGSLSGQNVTLLNALNGGVTTNDQLLVTTSNPSVLSLSKYNSSSTTSDTVPANNSGVASMPTISYGKAGTATITVKDLSNPTVPAITETVTVQPGAATDDPAIEYGGASVTSSNPLSLTANQPVELQVTNVDKGGNPVVVTGTSPVSVALPTLPSGLQWQTSSGGTGSQALTVPIQPGQSTTNVWIVSSTSQSWSGLGNAQESAASAIQATASSTAGDASVSWTAPTDAADLGISGYQIWVIPVVNGVPDLSNAYQYQGSETESSTAGTGDDVTSSPTTVTDLTSGSSYKINVDAVYSNGTVVKGVPSNTFTSN